MKRRLSHLITLITSSRRAVGLTALSILLIVGPLKFFLVRTLLSIGVPREALQAQDAILSAALSAALVWMLLMAVRVKRTQLEEQIGVVADLNHNIRNALEVIFNSDYLLKSEKATAILESVERIDNTLKVLMPEPRAQKPRASDSAPASLPVEPKP